MDPKTGARTVDFAGTVRFLESLSSDEFYIDQIELGNDGATSIAGLSSDFYDIAKTCVRYVYVATSPDFKYEKRTVFLKGSTLTRADADFLKANPVKNECEIKPIN